MSKKKKIIKILAILLAVTLIVVLMVLNSIDRAFAKEIENFGQKMVDFESDEIDLKEAKLNIERLGISELENLEELTMQEITNMGININNINEYMFLENKTTGDLIYIIKAEQEYLQSISSQIKILADDKIILSGNEDVKEVETIIENGAIIIAATSNNENVIKAIEISKINNFELFSSYNEEDFFELVSYNNVGEVNQENMIDGENIKEFTMYKSISEEDYTLVIIAKEELWKKDDMQAGIEKGLDIIRDLENEKALKQAMEREQEIYNKYQSTDNENIAMTEEDIEALEKINVDSIYDNYTKLEKSGYTIYILSDEDKETIENLII